MALSVLRDVLQARSRQGPYSRVLMGILLVTFNIIVVSPVGAQSLVTGPADHEFSFARLVYGNNSSSWDDDFGWPRWRADWPHAEQHFLAGLQRLTAIDTGADGVLVAALDQNLFDYPWLYAVEVGSLSLNDVEVANLREYLLRGGFLMVDDFHGEPEWQAFERVMARVFPDRPIEDLSDTDEAFHVLFDLSQKEQIPGIRALMAQRTWEKGGRFARWRGIRDDLGRVMIAINFNQDIGDAWEHADDPAYPEPFSAMAYRMGVNYVVYAMTH